MGPDEDSDGEELQKNYDWQKYKVRSQPNNTGFNTNNSKRDIIDTFFTYVNRDLLICKLFYFFFFGAFGSLFPLLAIYFKQLGMNPSQSGILIGFRPFVEFCSAPFWGGLADKYKKGKQLMIFALVCWIIFTLSIAFVTPPPHHCHETNQSYVSRDEYKSNIWRGKRDFPFQYSLEQFNNMHIRHRREKEMPFSNDQNEGFKTPKSLSTSTAKTNLNFIPASIQKTTVKDVGNDVQTPTPTPKSGTKNVEYNVQTQAPTPKSGTMPYSPNHDIHTPTRIENDEFIKPKYSTIYYEKGAVQDVFFTLLLLVIIGEFFSAPAITFADSVTLAYLGEDTDNYGRQRMFGSLGWGLSMFFVGLALDQSTTIPNHPCGLQYIAEKNYMVCFAVFTVLMSCALITATQFKFDHRHGGGKDFQLTEFVSKVKDTVMETITGKRPLDRSTLFRKNEDDDIDYLESKATMQRQMEAKQNGDVVQTTEQTTDTTDPSLSDTANGKNVEITLQNRKDMVSDVTHSPTDGRPDGEGDDDAFFGKWVAVLKMLCTYKYLSVIFISWFMGFGIGLIFTFLFWHLQDLGGSPTLFGVASVFNHVSELLAYFLSRKIISKCGHVKVLYAGMLGNVVRFMYISWLKNPWWVLPFEFVQGLTHAAVWAACCSYITQAIPLGLRSSAQGILQGFHHGLGRGCGAVFGGIMVYKYGAEVTFRAYGVTCLILLIVYALGNFFLVDRGTFTYGGRDNHAILEEDDDDNQCHLAPHGVPSGMARDLSSSKLQQDGYSNYGSTTYKNDPFGENQTYNVYNPVDTQGARMDQTPIAPTQIFQQQPTNSYDQNYGP